MFIDLPHLPSWGDDLSPHFVTTKEDLSVDSVLSFEKEGVESATFGHSK